ncbi:MAG: flagellar biosynthetic protein FliO [Betaproteobacteria bacterium]|nr:flagellar biosynthetic protein FliO [Betaproteobacteria bacterium]
MARWFTLWLCCLGQAAWGADPAKAAYVPPSVMSLESIFQVVFSLLLVLGVVALVAWLLKRVQLPQQGVGRQLKVVSSIAVGQRERVVLVEIQDTWLVLGVAAGQVRTLHTLPKQGGAPGHAV